MKVDTPSFPAAPEARKVPEIDIWFWVVKILTTTIGETAADYFAVEAGWGQGVTRALMGTLLAVALWRQMRSPRYSPARYWCAVILVSIVGTQITDFLTDTLQLSLLISTSFFALALGLAFYLWKKREGTLDILTITQGRRERFYWIAIFATFALGTAAGDLATEMLGMGFAIGTAVFGCAIATLATARFLGADKTFCFWGVYILTRPLGAALGDLLTQAREYGGLGLGAKMTSLLFLSAILLLLALPKPRRLLAAKSSKAISL